MRSAAALYNADSVERCAGVAIMAPPIRWDCGRWTPAARSIIVHPSDVASVIVHSTGDDAGAFLSALGERVRQLRARRGMTRRILARDSGVSERYLAQLEGGQGNASLAILRRIARALDAPLESLVADTPEPPVELAHTVELLRRLGPEQLGEARTLLLKTFGDADAEARAHRIALIGLRGAGKS